MMNFFQTKEAQNDQQMQHFLQKSQVKDENSKFNLTDISSFQYQKSNIQNQTDTLLQQEQSYFSANVPIKEDTQKPTPNFLFYKKQQQTNVEENDENIQQQDCQNLPQKFFKCNEWKIEDFKIGRPLGKGRFGRVYLAKVKKTGFIVALKIVSKKMVIKQKFQRQIYREIEIQSKLDHPNLLKMYGYFWDDQKLYQILEYGVYGELFDELNKQPLCRFKEQVVSKYMKQAINAFIYLHSLKIIHRDLKPENILIGHDGIKIADFNWSIHCPSNKRKTYCGTFQYICPEMAKNENYSNKLDLWCLGVLCYELSTGISPFEVQNTQQLLVKYKDIKRHLIFPKHLSSEIKHFMTGFLQANPAKRMTLEEALNHEFILKYNK